MSVINAPHSHSFCPLSYTCYSLYSFNIFPPTRVRTAKREAQRQGASNVCEVKRVAEWEGGLWGSGRVKIHSEPHFQLGSTSCYHRCVRIGAAGVQMSEMNPYLRHKAGPWHAICKLLSACAAYTNFIPVWWHYPLFALFDHLNAWLEEENALLILHSHFYCLMRV